MTVKNKVKYAIIIAVCAAAVIVTAVVYSLFASSQIFTESEDHLTEIYGQARTTFLQSVEHNRNLLKSWEQYIDNCVDVINGDDADASQASHKELVDFIEKQREDIWGFTGFYFIGGEKTDPNADNQFNNLVDCVNIKGEPTQFRIMRKLTDLLESDRGGVVGTCEDLGEAGGTYMLFAVSVNSNKYKDKDGNDFEYQAIGFSFDTEDVKNLLSLQAFRGKGQFYISLSDGTVLLQTDSAHSSVHNLFDHFKHDNVSVSKKTIDAIRADWLGKTDANGVVTQAADTVLVEEGGVEYYFTYMPVGFSEWMLVGIVPSSEVNSSMNTFRTVTIIVMAGIFILIAAAVAWVLISLSRQRFKEKALEVKSREKLLDLLTMNSNDIYIVFSPETFQAGYVSSNIRKVLGISEDEVKKDVHAVMEAFDGEYKAFTADGLKSLSVGNVWEKDMRMTNKENGAKYWFRMSLYRFFDGKRDDYVMVFSDRTEDKSMRERLEEALNLAKNANEAKSHFLSNMSHDIRTPMNAILGYATLLAKDADNAERVREYTHKISYSGQHLLSLINDILDMSKIESGKTSLNMEEFSLPEFIEELYAMMIAQTNAKKQIFDVHTKGKLPEYVLGDKLRLNQIMLNILSNAVKYTPDGGKIDLKVETMKQNVHNHVHLLFTVADNGIGMSEEYVKTIFDPFTREDTAATRKIQGTGLGMAITKNIVDLMGGIITVDSTPQKGSTFTVELELQIADQIPDDEDFWQHHNVTRVLVVDDEEDVCMDIKELMSDTGVEIQYELTGKAAVAAVTKALKEKNDFHIVLLDWKMPDMDGVETARRIRAKVGRDVPIMVLTSYSFEDIEEEAKGAGIDLFMSKPFFVSNFRRAIMQIRSDGPKADIEPEKENVSMKGLKVLAAEDNEINAEILTELLDIEEVECVIAVNGKEAVEKFEASEPGTYSLIFMDIQMPVMNGHDAARAIRASKHKDAQKIPIIAMTANAFDDDVKAALDAGMNAHLAKPIDMEKLKQLVVKLCGKEGEI